MIMAQNLMLAVNAVCAQRTKYKVLDILDGVWPGINCIHNLRITLATPLP